MRTHRRMWGYCAIAAILTLTSLTHGPPFTDLVQDYAAAWAVLHQRDPNGPTGPLMAACCPEWVELHGIVWQTAHPPAATLVTLAVAWLPWQRAKWMWLALSAVVLVVGWWVLGLDLGTVIALAWPSLFALSLGSLEPLLFVLLAVAMRGHLRPAVAGSMLGLAVSIKVYPVALVVGLIMASRWRTALIALGVTLLVGSLAELVVGGTWQWVSYTPVNVLTHLEVQANLVRLVHLALPHVAPGSISAALLGGLTVPLLPYLRQQPLQAMVPVMLLASPLAWTQYQVMLGLVPLGRVERGLLLLTGSLVALVLLGVLPYGWAAPVVPWLLFLVVGWVWGRLVWQGQNGLVLLKDRYVHQSPTCS